MDANGLDESLVESINQTICAKFVRDEVIACVSDMVEIDFGQAPTGLYRIDSCDIKNFRRYPEYYGNYARFEGGSEGDREEEIERLTNVMETTVMLSHHDGNIDLETIKHEIDSEIHSMKQLELEDAEIFEWWIVSGWLGRKLEEKGYPVVERYMGWLWGRTTTGQSISIDHVIRDIASDMELLYGQKNESRYHSN